MGPTNHSMLCSSSPVPRVVGDEIGLTTAPIEFYHGHTTIFYELTRVDGTLSNEASMDPNNYTSGPMLCSSSHVSRVVGNQIRPHDYSNRMLS